MGGRDQSALHAEQTELLRICVFYIPQPTLIMSQHGDLRGDPADATTVTACSLYPAPCEKNACCICVDEGVDLGAEAMISSACRREVTDWSPIMSPTKLRPYNVTG